MKYWLFNTDPCNGLLESLQNWSPILNNQPRFWSLLNSYQHLKNMVMKVLLGIQVEQQKQKKHWNTPLKIKIKILNSLRLSPLFHTEN